jgi:hypothetical protein
MANVYGYMQEAKYWLFMVRCKEAIDSVIGMNSR